MVQSEITFKELFLEHQFYVIMFHYMSLNERNLLLSVDMLMLINTNVKILL